MSSGILEAARNCNRLGQGDVAPQVVFPRVPDLAVGYEERLFKILQHQRNDRIVQDLAVGGLQSVGQFRHRLSLHFEIAHAPQSDESVRLDRYSSLIELRA